MKFKIGQIFEGIYPHEAAYWCEKNNATIEVFEGGYRIIELEESKEFLEDDQ
jgi:hypothetical protein